MNTNEVLLLQRLYANEKALYFLGPRISSAADGLAAEMRSVWEGLVHVEEGAGSVPGGMMEPVDPGDNNPIFKGGYGVEIGAFPVQATVYQVTAGTNADTFGRLGTADVLVGHPSPGPTNQNQTRVFTQSIPLVDGASSESVVEQRRIAFQNAMCWLLYCGACPSAYPTISNWVTAEVLRTGSPLTLHLLLGNGGECDGAGFRVTITLADGMRVLGVESPVGEVVSSNGVVVLYMGRLADRYHFELDLSLLPVIPGVQTNQVHIEFGAAAAYDVTITFAVPGDRIPELKIERDGLDGIALHVQAQVGLSYVLERAISQTGFANLSWVTLTNFVFTAPSFDFYTPLTTTNRATFYRVKTAP